MSQNKEQRDHAVSNQLSELHALLGAHSSKFLKEVFPKETGDFIAAFVYVNHPEELPTRETAKEIPFGLGDTFSFIKKQKHYHKRSTRKAKK